MKKAIVLLLALVVVGAFAFAQDDMAPAKDVPSYEFTASADLLWQYDLDANLSGFTNEWDLSLKYHLLNDVSKTTGGEGTYGIIEVTHLNLNLMALAEDGDPGANFSDTDGSASWGVGSDDGATDYLAVSAKIVSGNFWVGLGHGAYTADYDNAVFVPLFSEDAGYDNGSAFEPLLGDGGSMQLGYMLGDMGKVSMVLGSPVEGAVNEFSEYYFGFDANLTPVKDLLAVDAGFWYDPVLEMWVATGKVTVTAGDLSAYAAIDLAKDETASDVDGATTGTDLAWDMSAQLKYSFMEAKDSITLNAYYTEQESTGAVPSYTLHKGDFGLTFADAGGFVAPLAFSVTALIDDLMGDAPDTLLSFAQDASYKVDLSDATYVKPYEALRKDLAGNKDLYLKVGVEAKLFANTVLDANVTVKTTSDDLNHAIAGDANTVFSMSAKVTL